MPRAGRRVLRSRAVLVASALGLAVGAAAVPAGAAPVRPDTPPPSCAATACSLRLFLVGAPQTWTVPAGVRVLTAKVAAASGTVATDRGGRQTAGLGGIVIARIGVTPAQTLTFVVGASGSHVNDRFRGYGGGGVGDAAAGGGGSFVYRGTTLLVAAGGGGGGGAFSTAEGRGYGLFGSGGNGSDGRYAGVGGLQNGATRTRPGVDPGDPATRGTGPATGPTTPGTGGAGAGGGGGGGWYGGGAGMLVADDIGSSTMLPGGGGSSFLAAGTVQTGHGHRLGDGYITLTWSS